MSVGDQLTFNVSVRQRDDSLIYFVLVKASFSDLISEILNVSIIIENHVPWDFECVRKSGKYARIATLLKVDHRNSVIVQR